MNASIIAVVVFVLSAGCYDAGDASALPTGSATQPDAPETSGVPEDPPGVPPKAAPPQPTLEAGTMVAGNVFHEWLLPQTPDFAGGVDCVGTAAYAFRKPFAIAAEWPDGAAVAPSRFVATILGVPTGIHRVTLADPDMVRVLDSVAIRDMVAGTYRAGVYAVTAQWCGPLAPGASLRVTAEMHYVSAIRGDPVAPGTPLGVLNVGGMLGAVDVMGPACTGFHAGTAADHPPWLDIPAHDSAGRPLVAKQLVMHSHLQPGSVAGAVCLVRYGPPSTVVAIGPVGRLEADGPFPPGTYLVTMDAATARGGVNVEVTVDLVAG